MPLTVVRGGGDLGTGIVHRMKRSGFDVVILEAERPLSVRRTVSFSEAVYLGSMVVEGMKAVCVRDAGAAAEISSSQDVPVMADEEAEFIKVVKPDVLVDARMLKRKNDTNTGMAAVVIGCGPGFEAGRDVHAVVETVRGHDLGRVIMHGSALPNTGKPGTIAGISQERVLYAPADGRVDVMMDIGSIADKEDVVAVVGGAEVRARIDGIVRGMIHPGSYVKMGTKIGDIDPRENAGYCYTISDKARAVAGGVLEAALCLGGFL